MRVIPALMLLALVACSGDEPAPPPQIDPATHRSTPLGEVVGFIDQYGARAWYGLPFAAPPLGDLRWRAPRPAAPWSGVREALSFASPCPQYGSPLGGATPEQSGKPMGAEDCLYLNVWAPPASAGAGPFPVMVWIHGGGNVVGHAGYYNGGNLATRENVVVLTVNYRMGPFGWFRHASLRTNADADDSSGNFGTLDNIQALRWVQQNIAAFGGDPANVTVFGESAGGTNVFALLLSPRATGLFHRAISQSGGIGFSTLTNAENFTDDTDPGHPWSSNEVLLKFLVKDGRAADRTAAKTVLAAMNPDAVASYLRTKSTWEVFDLYREGAGFLGPDSPKLFQDGTVVSAGDALALLADPAGHNVVPVMLGTNRDEPKLFMINDPQAVTSVFGVPLRTKDPEAYDRLAKFSAMSWKQSGVDDPARALNSASPGRVFAYRWDWDEEGTRLGFIDISQMVGAAHGIEIPFVFGHWELGPSTGSLFDENNAPGRIALSNAMMGYWAAMAREGDPGTGGGDHPRWAAWSAEPGGPRTLILDTTEGGGIRMTDIEVTEDSLLASMENEPGLDNTARCNLFARVFQFSDERERVEAAKARFAGGACAGVDLAAETLQ